MRRYPTKLNPNTLVHDTSNYVLNTLLHKIYPLSFQLQFQFFNTQRTDFGSTQITELYIAN